MEREPGARRIPSLIALTLAAILLCSLGAAGALYYLMIRASEDAYAMNLWKTASKNSRATEALFQSLADEFEIQVSRPAGPAAAADLPKAEENAGRIFEALSSQYGKWIVAVERTAPDGRRVELWPPSLAASLAPGAPMTTPASVPDPRGRGHAFLAEARPDPPAAIAALRAGPPGRWLIPLIVPIRGDVMGHWILYVSSAPLEESLAADTAGRAIAEFWVVSSNAVLAGRCPKELRNVADEDIRPLITQPEGEFGGFTVVRENGVRKLAVSARILLPGGAAWSLGVSLPYQMVGIAPHALFKINVIILAWLIPLLGLLLLFAFKTLLTSAENRTRQRIRHELETARSQLYALIELCPEAIVLMEASADFPLLFVSQHIEALTGHAAVELMAEPKAWSRLTHPDDRAQVENNRRAASTERRTTSLVYRIKSRRGEWMAVRETLAPLDAADNRPAPLLGLLTPARTDVPVSTDAILAKPVDPDASPKARILLVDDDHLLVSLCYAGLRAHGYGITPAYNGLQAVELFSLDPAHYDLVILDMVMPRMSGLEAIGRLRKLRPQLPILGISGYGPGEIGWDTRTQKIDDFLGKPFEVEDLLQHVEQMLGKT